MMIDALLLIFLSIVVVFVLFLILREFLGWQICAVCAGVTLTWVGMLALYWLGQFHEAILIAPLLGASAVGFYYLVEKKTKEQLQVFRLPFFLTLLFTVYLLLGAIERYFELLLFLAFLWGLFGAFYVYRRNLRIKKLVARLIACCKNW